MTRAVLLDLGGVLETGCWPGTARAWAPRLGITTGQVLAAVFGGSDDTVLTGQKSEDDWWQQVRLRLGITPAALGGLRADIAARWCWDEQLVACLDGVRGQARTAIVSNAWPHARARLDADGVAGLVDAVVLWSPACPVPPGKKRVLIGRAPPVTPELLITPLEVLGRDAEHTGVLQRVARQPATSALKCTHQARTPRPHGASMRPGPFLPNTFSFPDVIPVGADDER